MTLQPTRHGNTRIFPASLDPRAVDVVTRLTQAGFETYLVGGCVRDLLLGQIPKDFDVSTEARPRQIRRVFRNCRVIGRRFKLAHVHFGEKIIEVATFRRNPSAADDQQGAAPDGSDSGDLLILRDNVFGTAEEDAVRRDFTINALLYDVGRNEVIDYVGGVEDIDNKTLRTIGDPAIRFAEDPVRMLRAIKFTARLGLTLEPTLEQALCDCAALIERSSPARVIEEIFKLLACGRAERSLAMLLEYGLLQRLLPELSGYWAEHHDELLALGQALDHVDGGRRQVSNAFLLAMLFHDPFRARLDQQPGSDPLAVLGELVAPAALRTSIPRRDVAHMKHMLVNQLRLERSRRGRRLRMNEFLVRPSTQEAIDLLYVRCLAGAVDAEQHAEWAWRLARELGDRARPGNSQDGDEGEHRPRRPRRRRRSRGGRSRNRSAEHSSPERRTGDSRPDSGRDAQPDSRRDSRPVPSPAAALQPSRPDDAPSAPLSPVDTDVVDAPTAPLPGGGLKGLVRSLIRKVIGQEGDSQPPAEATVAPPAERPDATAAASAAGHPGDGDRPRGDSSDAPATADGKRGSDGRPDSARPRRRRRRRRSPSGSDQPAQAGQDQDGDGQGQAGEPGGAAAKDGSRQPTRRRRRRRSRGGRGRGAGQRQGRGPSDEPTSSDADSASSRSPSRRSRGADAQRDEASRRKRRKRTPDRTTDPGEANKPSRWQPEDVEDTFDW